MSSNPLRKDPSGDASGLTQQDRCDAANAKMLADPKGRRDVHWYVHNGEIRIGWNHEPGLGPKIVSADIMDRKGQRLSFADTERLNARLEQLGAWARYRPDGSRYDVLTGEDRPLINTGG